VELIDAIRTRRSGGRLLEECPSDSELDDLLRLAMNGPDHASLRPWRLVIVRDDARIALGQALAAAQGGSAEEAERTAAKPLRAPLLVALVFCPKPHPKVPEWEQLAATAVMIGNLCLLLHGNGWAATWRTGPFLDAEAVRAVMALDTTEKLLGWLYIGRPDPRAARPTRPEPSTEGHLGVLDLRLAEAVATNPAR
jgi:nitroreductase